MHCVTLKSKLSFAQISKNKPTNPSPYLHADVHLPSKPYLPEKQQLPSKPEKPQAQEPTIVPPTTIIPADTDIPEVCPVSKKRLLIRVQVESGRVVSESSHYTED